MKATGIVRRIDDLGRVVIPKEIRRTMRIREGEPLEIYTDRDGEVIFKKYSPVGELSAFAVQCAEALSKTADLPALVCDRDAVIAVAGLAKKEVEGKLLSTEYEKLMEGRQPVGRSRSEPLPCVLDGVERTRALAAAPIIEGGDVIGSVALLGDAAAAGEVEIKLTQNCAAFLSKQLEP